jgi:RNA polymerase sigma-70 factor (ECF subfamily)
MSAEKKAANESGGNVDIHTHLAGKLKELFETPPSPLPARFIELLDALATGEKQQSISSTFRDSLLATVPNLRAFAFSLCNHREQADDLVQETLLKAWSHFDSFQEGTNLRAWVFTILRNAFLSQVRKRRREVEDADGSLVDGLSVAPTQNGHVDLADMRRALALLPPDQREALVLVSAAGMSYEEAAEIAQCAVGTVKSRVNRARTKLADLLGLSGDEVFAPDAVMVAAADTFDR